MIKVINIFHHHCFPTCLQKCGNLHKSTIFVIQNEKDKIILTKQELMHMKEGKKIQFCVVLKGLVIAFIVSTPII